MRQVIISDTHTKENIELICDYLKKLVLKFDFDSIVINGDILGIMGLIIIRIHLS
jgi:predicted phosphodiesterase